MIIFYKNLKETIALPSKAKTYTFKDIFSLVPEKMKNPKTMINGLKEKVSKMSEEEFAQFRELYKRLNEKLRPQVYG